MHLQQPWYERKKKLSLDRQGFLPYLVFILPSARPQTTPSFWLSNRKRKQNKRKDRAKPRQVAPSVG